MRKFFFAFIILIILASLALLVLSLKEKYKRSSASTPVAIKGPIVTIRDKTFTVEVADSPQERSIGLSNRQSLTQNAGMLFVFENPGIQAFWMKNTLIPLDMIFVHDDQIVTIHRNVPVQAPETPDTQLPRYAPTGPVNFVLEINAGLSDTYGFTEGDTVEIKGL